MKTKRFIGAGLLAGSLLLGGCTLVPTTPPTPPTTTTPQSGCEHSSNFSAPAGCPDDGSGPARPDVVCFSLDCPSLENL